MLGWFGRDPFSSEPDAARHLRLLAHRGPDDAGWETGDRWALGFRRLSILDLSATGHQPMRSADGRCCIVFNGEIYNYRELRQEMESRGRVFRGTSDSEVLLALLSEDGAAALPRLNGMFAFAFVDAAARRFLVARDRLGVKPLYLTRTRGGIAFASELKALLAMPGASPRLNLTSTVQYMALNYLPSESCILDGYEKVMPAHLLAGSLDDPESAEARCYWDLDIEEREDGDITPGALDELDALLEDATRIRLRSDVPVGVFLSGGIDSGLVAAYASRPGTTMPPPRALTVTFAEDDHDETGLAAQTAAHLRAEHTLIECQPARLDDVDRLAWYFDEPFGDASALPTFALCEAASTFGKVFLSGDGGDGSVLAATSGISKRSASAGGAAARGGAGPVGARGADARGHVGAAGQLVKASLPDAGFGRGSTASEDPVLATILDPARTASARGRDADVVPLASHERPQPAGAPAGAGLRPLSARRHPRESGSRVDGALDRSALRPCSTIASSSGPRASRAALCTATEGKRPLRALAARHLPDGVRCGRKRGFGVPLPDRRFRRDAGIRFLKTGCSRVKPSGARSDRVRRDA
jgi:asparagine synthase (glutamine-hydrolysing)